MSEPMTPERRQEITAWATGHSQGDAYCRELLAELDAQGNCDQHTKRIYSLRAEVDRLTEERDAQARERQLDAEALRALTDQRDAARAELAGLRQRVLAATGGMHRDDRRLIETAMDGHVVTEHWDGAGGDVTSRSCACGEKWTEDREECPEAPPDRHPSPSACPDAVTEGVAGDG